MKDMPPIPAELLENTQARVERPVMEAIQEVFHRMPWGQTFRLLNGGEAVISKFVEPRLNHESGKPEFGFDVKAVDGSWHLEFFVRNTGWGGAP